MAFIFNGMLYKVQRDPHEANEIYLERGNFIACQTPKNKNDYNNAVIFSRIYINVKYFKCCYNENITNTLNNMIKNIYV